MMFAFPCPTMLTTAVVLENKADALAGSVLEMIFGDEPVMADVPEPFTGTSRNTGSAHGGIA